LILNKNTVKCVLQLVGADMPYIKQKDRPPLKTLAREAADKVECAGDINYFMTEMIHAYIKRKGLKYANVNEVIGAIECMKLELYRKIAAPYEDEKIKENGDVGLNESEPIIPTKAY
jgi:hypothetical protein